MTKAEELIKQIIEADIDIDPLTDKELRLLRKSVDDIIRRVAYDFGLKVRTSKTAYEWIWEVSSQESGRAHGHMYGVKDPNVNKAYSQLKLELKAGGLMRRFGHRKEVVVEPRLLKRGAFEVIV